MELVSVLIDVVVDLESPPCFEVAFFSTTMQIHGYISFRHYKQK